MLLSFLEQLAYQTDKGRKTMLKYVLFLGSWIKKVFLDDCYVLHVKASHQEKSFQTYFFRHEYHICGVALTDPSLAKQILGNGFVEEFTVPLPYGVGLYHGKKSKVDDSYAFFDEEGTQWNGFVVRKRVSTLNFRRLHISWLAHCARAVSFSLVYLHE
ncbi:MAG: hypothetical protein OQJ98_00780 [Candidatus Pacebacteria bacterium]|nr:hypothetical protein [Candidatus Paceibacterota bacterium]